MLLIIFSLSLKAKQVKASSKCNVMAAKMNLLAQRSSYGAESGKGYVFLTQDRKLDSTQKFTAFGQVSC